MDPRYATLSRQVERELLARRPKYQVLMVALAIKQLSYDRERDAAPVDEQRDLAAALCMDPSDCDKALGELERRKIVRILRGGGRWWYELQPDVTLWLEPEKARDPDAPKSRRAASREAIEGAQAAWSRLEAGSDGDPRQLAMFPRDPIREERGHGFEAARAEASREVALARGTSNSTNGEIPHPPITAGRSGSADGEIPHLRQWGNSPSASRVGARAPEHEHDHDYGAPHPMTHDHVGMLPVGRNVPHGGRRGAPPPLVTNEQLELMEGIDELVADEDERRAFYGTWCWRIHEHPVEVWKATQETRVMKREGRIKTTPGRTLNNNFIRLRELKKRARSAQRTMQTETTRT